MSKLSLFVLVLASIGCNDGDVSAGGRCITSSDCAVDDFICEVADCVEQRCEVRRKTPEEAPACHPQSDAPPIGELQLQHFDDDSVMLTGQLEDTQGFADYVTAERDRFDFPLNTCEQRGVLVLPPSPPTPISGGLLQITSAGGLADVPHDAGYFYLFAPGDIPPGQAVTFDLAGDGSIRGTSGAVQLPDLPVVVAGTDVGNGTVVLAKTMTFDPTGADRVRIIFNVFTGSTLDTYDCLADGAAGSFTIPDEVYNLLDDSGSFSVNFENTLSHGIETDAGARSLLWTSQTGVGVTWSSKAP